MTKLQDFITRNFGWIAVALGASFWVSESLIHAFWFKEGPFLQQLTDPGSNEVWMRSLVAILVIAFGFYIQWTIKKINDPKAGEHTISIIKLAPYTVLVIIFWTTIVAASLAWNIYQQYNTAYEAAKYEAYMASNKDIAYRRWVNSHGGVYVPITKKTPPSPYLSHIKDRDITSLSGRKLTLVNPAYMTRQVHELAADQYGVRGHITSLKPLRPENKPDQ